MRDETSVKALQDSGAAQALKNIEWAKENTDCCLLLHEVLLEEYDSLEQPPLDSRELEEVRSAGASNKAYFQGEAFQRLDGSEREREQRERNGKVARDLFSLMSRAQKKAAQEIVNKYEKIYEKFPEEHRQAIINRAVLSEMTGELQSRFQKLKEEQTRREGAEEDDKQLEENVLRQLLLAIQAEAIAQQQQGEAGGLQQAAVATGATRAPVDKAKILYAQARRSALCLSGGGIRSATFNLGILQGLARHGLLDRFDYLSTVSGGGFVGGWLSAWIYRRGLAGVVEGLKNPPKTPFDPDPDPVEHLRIYSNYLSPQPGLLSADTWTLVASVLRNLLLNWLVFVPFLIVLLMLPRLWAAIVLRSTLYEQYSLPLYLAVGIIASMWGFSYIGLRLPSSNDYTHNPPAQSHKGYQGRFIWFCLLPLMIGAAASSTYVWGRLRLTREPLAWYGFVAYTLAIVIPAWIICAVKVYRVTRPERRNKALILKLIGAAILIICAQLITGYLLRYATESFLPGPHPKGLLFASFAVPLFLLIFSINGTLIAGFTSQFTNDGDQEWWARAGAWLLIGTIAWSILHLLVLYGPLMLLTLGSTLQQWNKKGFMQLPWREWGKLLGTVAGVVSGIITLVGGFSAKTPANEKEARKVGFAGNALSILTGLVAPLFLAFVLVLIATGTNYLLTNTLGQKLCYWLTGSYLPSATYHRLVLSATPVRYLLVAMLLVGLLTLVFGRIINTNIFSLHAMWRNRLIRAYLGASHQKRRPDPFTGFDTYDNLQMYELRQQPAGVPAPGPRAGRPEDDRRHESQSGKLFHVLNIALNLAGGEKLQWQDRRAESFTVSPFHAGSYWLGYRRSFRYGGEEGISLGTAVAISGAFVSPNMGYMMTSPVVRFVMTLFNVRFGWWLGNPGPAGGIVPYLERFLSWSFRSKRAYPFNLRSPHLSIIPITSEAFGNTDDKSSYVYLSDGGHFENLGLYEMVLRRCRFIVVSDASTDPDYGFQSLAMAVRQIRVDLGVPIDLPEWAITSPSYDMKGKYCAVGKIRYSCVDRDPQDRDKRDEDFDGILIYLKPSLIGDEPRDIINYAQGSPSFPQEIIVDQWFSESQFESYRALGSHMIDTICGGSTNQLNLVSFAQRAREHNQIDFRTFQEKIYYTAFEHQFKEGIQTMPDSFKRKVRDFFDKLFE